MILTVKSRSSSYDVVIERGVLGRIGTLADLNRKALIVTDKGVPKEYAELVAKQCKAPVIEVLPGGEQCKSLYSFERLCSIMQNEHFSRKDVVIAVGGGIVGDLAGFAASAYMRGLDFINLPTTSLSQIDSSIGGKTAVNLNGIKNIVGAFHQPILVAVDSDVLKTLPQRHLANGLVEALKSGLIYDEKLFELFFEEELDIDEIVYRSLLVKKSVVEQDEEEKGLRRILNFGHTLGHGIESAGLDGSILHGEAVAYGMIPMIDDENTANRAKEAIKRLGIPPMPGFDREKAFFAVENDKKADGESIVTVRVEAPGKAYCKSVDKETLKEMLLSI